MMTEADLAYMREVQAAFRPTAANLQSRTSGPDGMGGRTDGYGADQPIMVRIDGSPEAIPTEIAGRYQGGSLVMVTADLVMLRSGDRIVVSATEVYQIVSDGDPDRWATAQQVVAERVAFPPGG